MDRFDVGQFDWEKYGSQWRGFAEASALGFPPGMFPNTLTVCGKTDERKFIRQTPSGIVNFVIYRNPKDRMIIRVAND